MKPVVFLDFDGVLNSLRSALVFGSYGRNQFDPVAIGLVARLADAADAHVVISSSWRVGQTIQGLCDILKKYSATLANKVIDVTPHGLGCRGEEIARWLAENPSKHNGIYVIVDDVAGMLDGQLPHFVQTRHRDGFGVPEYLKALSIIAPSHKDLDQFAWYAEDKPLSSASHWLECM